MKIHIFELRRRYEDMIDHRSYAHNCLSCVHNWDDLYYPHIDEHLVTDNSIFLPYEEEKHFMGKVSFNKKGLAVGILT